MLNIVTSVVDISPSGNTNFTSSSQLIDHPRAIALGNFDGIHQGHQKVIEPIFQDSYARTLSPSLVTFVPHPQEFFSGQKKKLLTPIKEKSALLETLGVQELILLPFDRELANLNPQDFIAEVLIKKLNAEFISIGEDFRFGYQRQGNADNLKAIASVYNVKVNITAQQNLSTVPTNQRISSSYIRQCLSEGKIALAEQMLSRPYQIVGQVEAGKKLGRTIGFPTANLAIPPEKFLPRFGVYAVQVLFPDRTHKHFPAVMNIGKRPTVDGSKLTVEVHILDWQGDLYGQELVVKLMHFIRPEQKFASIDELKNQIQLDCQSAKKHLSLP